MSTIIQLLNEVMKDVGAISKSDKNTSQGFNFRGIDSVINAVSPAMRKHGIVVVPSVEDYQYESVEIGKNRTVMGHVKVKVTYTFAGPEGDAIKATVVGEAMDSGDKATAKAMSVAFRTALLQSLCLPTDEPDPDSYSYERSEAKPNAGIDQVEGWKIRLQDAVDGDVLEVIRQEVNKFEVSDALKKELAVIYTARLRELQTPKVAPASPN